MGVSRSVQFYGIRNAVDAYENAAVPAWGLFQGAQFLAKYEGSDIDEGKSLLESFLEKIDTRYGSNNATTYTLAVYESPGKITNKTNYDGSFNFRLVGDMDPGGRDQSLGEKIGSIVDDRLKKYFPDEEPEAKPKTIWDHVNTMLENPEIQSAVASRVIGFIDRITGVSYELPSPAAVGSVGMQLETDEVNKLNQALQILSGVDPQIGSHLLRIAIVAKNDPEKYKQLIGMLKMF